MPSCFQILAKFAMIVDFSVENNPEALVFVADRLMPRLNVNDAQSAHGEPDVFAHVETIVVGTAVGNLLVHRRENIPVYSHLPIRIKDSADSTHD